MKRLPISIFAILLATGAVHAAVFFAVTNSWPAGLNGEITLTNEGAGAVTGWTLEFDFPGTIKNLWNGTLTSHTGTHYVVHDAGHNAAIAAGAKVVVGFTAEPASPARPPSNFVLNGAPTGGVKGGAMPPPLPPPATNTTGKVVAPRAAIGRAGYLSTRGNQLVDCGGKPVRIAGINWFGFETNNGILHGLWTRGYKSALDQIKQLGFNTLRIPYSNAMLRDDAATNSINFPQNPDLQGLTPLQCLDKVVEYCGQIGLRVILDRHSARADGYMGEDVWFIPGDAYYTEARWIGDWVLLATRYAGNATVIGADLFNEPKRTATWGNSAPATDWNKAAERCGNAVLAANPNWLVIVEGIEKFDGKGYWWGGNLKGAATFPVVLKGSNKLVYSMHDYPASVYAQPWFNAANYPRNLSGVWDEHFGYIFKNNTAPLLLGEFGSKLQTPVDRQWLDKLTDYIDGDFDLNGTNDLTAGNQGISWTFWSFNPNSGDTGGILRDDWTTVDQTKLGYLRASMAPLIGGGGIRP